MTRLYNLPTNQQLITLATTLNENLKDVKKDNITIVFELEKEYLRQMDEECFLKNNKDAKMSDFEPADEVYLNILGINFKFTLKNVE